MMLFAIVSLLVVQSASGMPWMNDMMNNTEVAKFFDNLANEATNVVRNWLPYPFHNVSNEGIMNYGKLLLNGLNKTRDELGDEMDQWAAKNGVKELFLQEIFDRYYNMSAEKMTAKRSEMNQMIARLSVDYKNFADILENTGLSPMQMMQEMCSMMKMMDMSQRQLLIDLITVGYGGPHLYYRKKREVNKDDAKKAPENPKEAVISALLQHMGSAEYRPIPM